MQARSAFFSAIAIAAIAVACKRPAKRSQEPVDQDEPAASASIAAKASTSPSTSTSSSTAEKPGTYHYGDVTLRGKLAEQMFYGPPNFGDDPAHDQKEWTFILELDAPIDVLREDDDDEWNEDRLAVKKIQIADTKDPKADLKPLVDKGVIVHGHLFGAHTGHHHTDVLVGSADVTQE